jgi:hypothetical protein
VRKRGRPKLLYWLVREVQVKARFGFEQTVRQVVAKRWEKNFGAAFARALRTRR